MSSKDTVPEEAQLMLHALRVQQIELEMQNEELRRVQLELDASRTRYFDLYELAPVGYCTVDEAGLILHANLTASALLGLARSELLKRPISRFIVQPDQDIYYQLRKQLLESGEPQSCELRLRAHDGTSFWAHLAATVAQSSADAPVLRVVLSDISVRKRAEQQLIASEESLRQSALHSQTILDNMADGVITIDAHGLIESFNKAASTIFGYLPEAMLGRNVVMLMPETVRSHYNDLLQQGQGQSKSPTNIVGVPREIQGQREDGSVFPMSLSVSRILRARQSIYIGIVRDITQHRQDEEEIRRLAFYDPLTGLPNRRLLIDRLKQAMVTSRRTGQHGALMFLDLDHFKRLNDTLGHAVGDVLLQQVALRLKDCVREGDSVARLGGDEFVVLLEGLSIHDHEAATQTEAVANKILNTSGQAYDLLGHSYSSTPSIGIVVFMEDHETMDELLKKADVAMYQAKSAGRNTVRFYDASAQAAATAHADLEKDMRRDLANNKFVLHYQIQVDADGAPVGAEALVRWNHGKLGMLAPAHFIRLAEASGMIRPLSQWILETACAELATWASQPLTAHWTMAVNISASQFSRADFVATVETALQSTGINARLLSLELTEKMLMDDTANSITKMNALKALGVGFSLDDFGTGYSSLSYLKQLPLHQLKIDLSFVRDILSNPSNAMIARTVVALGHSLGLTVMAEGVETAAQGAMLSELGCDAFQGWHFGPPAPASELTGFIGKNTA